MRFISKESAFIISIGLIGFPAYTLWQARVTAWREQEAKEAARRQRVRRPGSA